MRMLVGVLILWSFVAFNCSVGKQRNNNYKTSVEKRKHPLDHLKDGQMIKVQGVFKIVGNEPRSLVALITSEKHYYYIPRKLDKLYRSLDYQNKFFEVQGSIKRNILRTPNGIEVVRVFLTPSKVTSLKD